MSVALSPISPAVEAELKRYKTTQLPKDMEHLRRGANHMRMIAWFIFLPSVFLSFVCFLYLLVRPMKGDVSIFVIMILFLGVSCFYFSVSAYIQRARRWAVYIAIFVSLVPILITIPLMLTPQIGFLQRTPFSMLVEMLYLIGHVKMIRDLVTCLGAVDRIHWATTLRFQDAKQREPWEAELK